MNEPDPDPTRRCVAATIVLAACLAFPTLAHAQGTDGPAASTASDGDSKNLTELSLEELMDMKVSIASRSEQKISDAPAAVYVLTGDEIRRAGFTSIPEALRMVPGFYVQRFDSNIWSVASRGFSGFFVSDLVVMIDGVSIYTPLFAGVWWELQSIDMNDVDRIEVIRGAGATLWGANAVTGIVNVITKNAADTQGAQVSVLAGREARELTVREGGKLSENGWFRVWAKGVDNSALVDSNDTVAAEHWQVGKAGFRADWNTSETDHLMVFGNAWMAGIQESYEVATQTAPFSFTETDRTPKIGGILSGTWEHHDSPDSSMKLSAWWSKDYQRQIDFTMSIDIADVDFQRTQKLTDTNTLSWGLGYRMIASHLPSIFTYTFDPISRLQQTPRAWAQDEIRFPSKNLSLTLGAQVEHTDFTGFEFQPTVRALWKPKEDQSIWAAVSRAVRTPSLEENDIVFRLPTDTSGDFFVEEGSGSVKSEDLLALETGWRWQANADVGVDVTAFYDQYDNLMTLEQGAPFTSGGLNFTPFVFANKGNAIVRGAELAVDWEATKRWRLRGGYSLLTLALSVDPGSTDNLNFLEQSAPENQFNLRSYLDLGAHWEFDCAGYFVDQVPSWNNPSYFRTDVRIGWNPNENVRVSVGAQNALEARHSEGGEDQIGVGSVVRTNYYVGVTISH